MQTVRLSLTILVMDMFGTTGRFLQDKELRLQDTPGRLVLLIFFCACATGQSQKLLPDSDQVWFDSFADPLEVIESNKVRF